MKGYHLKKQLDPDLLALPCGGCLLPKNQGNISIPVSPAPSHAFVPSHSIAAGWALMDMVSVRSSVDAKVAHLDVLAIQTPQDHATGLLKKTPTPESLQRHGRGVTLVGRLFLKFVGLHAICVDWAPPTHGGNSCRVPTITMAQVLGSAKPAHTLPKARCCVPQICWRQGSWGGVLRGR